MNRYIFQRGRTKNFKTVFNPGYTTKKRGWGLGLSLTKRIVEEYQLTCLMITHNMQSAIDLGNRILMMDSGNIVLDIGEEEKKNMTVDVLLEKFKTGAGKALDNDRILLSE